MAELRGGLKTRRSTPALNAGDVVSIPDLVKLTVPLRKAEHTGRVLPHGHKAIWVTKVSYDSNRPTLTECRSTSTRAGSHGWRTAYSTIVRRQQVVERTVPVRERHGRWRAVVGGERSLMWAG